MKHFVLLLILSTYLLFSAIPSNISWQGVISDDSGNLLDGTYDITIVLYDVETGGTALWTESQTLDIENGYVNLTLGKISALNLDFDEQYWLEITVDSGTPLSRVQLNSVPYAINAKNVEGITNTNISNWNTAFGWGDHSDQGYLTEYTETDPIYSASDAAGISGTNIINWNTAFDWGNHADEGYLTEYTETDPIFSASDAAGISGTNIINWNEAYGWGDHAEAGYLTSMDEEDPTWIGDANSTGIISRNGSIGIGISSPTALIHTYGIGDGEGNILFEGEFKPSNQGDPPIEGAGTRMMWYPDKAAFRAGYVNNTNWDKVDIGNYSFATGVNTKASGSSSNALGFYTTASGNNAISAGVYAVASGGVSLSIGYITESEGEFASSFGYQTDADGDISTSFGKNTKASSYIETVFGSFNTDYTPNSTDSWNENDRLFVIGNGENSSYKSNALTILKNGNTGLGIDEPTALLHTYGTGSAEGNVLFEGEFKSSDPGDPPAVGEGTRMMWYPDKAAFRAGYVSGDHWDKDTIGYFSVAFGEDNISFGESSFTSGKMNTNNGDYSTVLGTGNTNNGSHSFIFGNLNEISGSYSNIFGSRNLATGILSFVTGNQNEVSDYAAFASGSYNESSGRNSFVTGYYNIASGDYSFSSGRYNDATGSESFAIGYSNLASGKYSYSSGERNTSSGESSFTHGDSLIAQSAYEVVIGRYNSLYTPSSTISWNSDDRLFVIGNGIPSNRKNILTVLKNGNIGIKNDNPGALLHIKDEGYENGIVIFEGEYRSAAGSLPVSGEGTRLIWYPSRAAFRVGYVSGNNWDYGSIGSYSFAAGYNTKANDDYTFAVGYNSEATGDYSTAMCRNTHAESFNEMVVGSYNTDYSPSGTTSWVQNDRLFVVGNGENSYSRSNAITILKNGKIGLQSEETPYYAFELPNNSNYGIGKARAYAWVTYSDGRLKSERQNIPYGLEEILSLNPIKYFHHNSNEKNANLIIENDGVYDIGFIAQDIYKIIPEIVTKPDDETNELWGMNYEKLTSVLVKAVQEQQDIIDEQNKRIQELEKQNSEMKNYQNELEIQNKKIDELEKQMLEIKALLK